MAPRATSARSRCSRRLAHRPHEGLPRRASGFDDVSPLRLANGPGRSGGCIMLEQGTEKFEQVVEEL